MKKISILAAALFAILFSFAMGARADSFSHYPDSVTFTPSSGQTTVTMNIYAFYNGDTSNGPGTTVHAWISTGSSYFRVDTVPHHFKSYWYWTVTYTVQTSQVTGYVSLSDDTNTQRIKLIGKTAPDGVLTGVGPYFTSITKMDSTSCTTLRLINNGSHRDTIVSAGWTHNPNGIFTWDTTNVPSTIGSHDTAFWTFCFHAPHDTNYHIDTFNIAYHDSSGSNKYVTRIVTAKATAPTPDADLATSTNSYFTTTMDSSICSTYKLINAGTDRDTITRFVWSHNPNGVFTYDTSAIPHVLNSHDSLSVTFCFHAPHDTLYHIDTLTIYYSDSMSSTRSITRVFYARATGPQPDGEITGYGPYFSTTQEDSTSCATFRMINSGRDKDTIVSAGWTQSTSIFTWDTSHVSLPHVMNAGDTVLWNICFHAPNDTLYHVDTFVVVYHDSLGTRTLRRTVYARAAAPSPDGYMRMAGPYWTTPVKEGASSCVNVAIINTGSDDDTITSAGWTHNSGGVFVWDTSSISLPQVVRAHDSAYWRFCFNAPSDTNYRIDTFTVNYSDAYNHTRSFSRIVSAHAVDSSLIDCYYIYAPSVRRTEVGDTSYVHVFLSNRIDSSVTLTAMHISGSGDAAYRVDSSTFPHTIAGHHYDSVWVAFIPYAGAISYPGTITCTFTVNDTVHCKTATASLNGTSAYTADDTTNFNFNDTGRASINMSGDSGHYSHRIDFVNTSSVRLLVHSLALTNTSHFYIAQILPGVPDTVAPGGHVSAIIHFYGDSSGTLYKDTLVVTVENGLTSFYVYMTGKSPGKQTSGVASAAARSQQLHIYPNPAQGLTEITLDGTATANFEVVNLLGEVVARHSGSAAWQWNAGELPAGTYYVRAQSASGTETKRIVITE